MMGMKGSGDGYGSYDCYSSFREVISADTVVSMNGCMA